MGALKKKKNKKHVYNVDKTTKYSLTFTLGTHPPVSCLHKLELKNPLKHELKFHLFTDSYTNIVK